MWRIWLWTAASTPCFTQETWVTLLLHFRRPQDFLANNIVLTSVNLWQPHFGQHYGDIFHLFLLLFIIIIAGFKGNKFSQGKILFPLWDSRLLLWLWECCLSVHHGEQQKWMIAKLSSCFSICHFRCYSTTTLILLVLLLLLLLDLKFATKHKNMTDQK